MALAQCPASCGEIIQGWILGGEKLVSCPVNWYSTIEISTGTPSRHEKPLVRAMVNQLLAHWQLPADLGREIRIECHSTIPVAKGMASSTADIAATAVATARHLNQPLGETALARLCVTLEPTDSTIFRQLSLFDHNSGETHIACAAQPEMDILLLESPLTLRTADYHRIDREKALRDNAGVLDLAWQKVQLACAQNSPQLLGEAATLSAIASQAVLPKPGFNALLDIVERCDLYGINVAHSGSVAGLYVDRKRHDVEEVLWWVRKSTETQAWPVQHLLRLVEGGVTLT
nr:L-threonine kinase [uncultured Enterobacter sp.]